ncbi:MAG: hypothetical protein PHG36_03700 [Dehalococcoidia bacterium]|nr:hypothetical protein [Dehalococcoidia bacterium]
MTITELLDNIEKLFTILGITAAGLWAYFNFFRGRTYKPRLEIEINGHILQRDEAYCLLVNLKLKNVGLSRLDLNQQGSGLRVFSYDMDAYLPEIHSVDWEQLATFSVFEQHNWIESGEVIVEQKLIALPEKNSLAFKLALRIVSHDKIAWYAETIIPASKMLGSSVKDDFITLD